MKFIRRYQSKMNDMSNGCCANIERQTIDFAIRMVMIFIILLFAMIQVLRIADVNQKQIYFGIITSILGYLIPSPTLKR